MVSLELFLTYVVLLTKLQIGSIRLVFWVHIAGGENGGILFSEYLSFIGRSFMDLGLILWIYNAHLDFDNICTQEVGLSR